MRLLLHSISIREYLNNKRQNSGPIVLKSYLYWFMSVENKHVDLRWSWKYFLLHWCVYCKKYCWLINYCQCQPIVRIQYINAYLHCDVLKIILVLLFADCGHYPNYSCIICKHTVIFWISHKIKNELTLFFRKKGKKAYVNYTKICRTKRTFL